MKTAVIVQARMTSTRLPGKVLLPLTGKTVLHHVLVRCAAIPGIDVVCCAVPDGKEHDAVAREAETVGAQVYRGSENDVLDRYWRAAAMLGADVIMRVTSDCPLIDPEVCGRVLRLVTQGGEVDYACNNLTPSWPHGLDCEAFTIAALKQAAAEARAPHEREHVTPWLRTHPDLLKANLPGPGGWAAGLRWTLDLPEDFEFFRALFRHLPPPPARPTTEDILALLRVHPEIVALNAQHHNISRPSTPTSGKEPL